MGWFACNYQPEQKHVSHGFSGQQLSCVMNHKLLTNWHCYGKMALVLIIELMMFCYCFPLSSGALLALLCWCQARERTSVPQAPGSRPSLSLQQQHVQLGLSPQPGELQQRAEPLPTPLSPVHLQSSTASTGEHFPSVVVKAAPLDSESQPFSIFGLN